MVGLFSRHSLALQTSFAEIKRRASELPTTLIGSPGSVSVREVKGRRFYYRQFYDAAGRKAADYVGPLDDPDAAARAQALKEQISEASSLAREARLLVQHGYVRADCSPSRGSGATRPRRRTKPPGSASASTSLPRPPAGGER